MELNIKNCPFCGSKAKLDLVTDDNTTFMIFRAFVECTQCEAQSYFVENKIYSEESSNKCVTEAVELWNKRSIGETVPVDRLNESYRQRALVVVKLAHLAQRLKYEVYRKEPKDGEWGILYIELPEGQVSWHFSDKDAHMIEQFPVDNRDRWNGKYNGRDEQVMLNQF